MKMPRPMRRSAGGFSMIEVLIALVVLAVGLLGLALLQTMNLRYTKSAQQRTLAVNLAGQLLDTIRANRSEVAAYAMEETDFDALGPMDENGCGTDETLSSSNNATRWQCEVREALGPQAWAEVDVDAAPEVTVTVTWDEDSFSALVGRARVVLVTTL